MKPGRSAFPDVSVVLVVRNAEDKVGSAARRIVQHLRSLDQSFEVLAINAGSWDTSFAVLKLLAVEVPELRVLDKDVGARVYVRGAAEARGSSVVFMDADRVPMSLSPLGWTLSRLAGGTEAVVVRSRWIAARRLPALPAIARARGRGDLFERSFEREAAELRLEVAGTARRVPSRLLAPVWRLLAA
jgi:hypothetical protein